MTHFDLDGWPDQDQVVVSDGVICSGTVLVYSDAPALGSLIFAMSATGGVDLYGNVYPIGITGEAPRAVHQ